MNTRSGEIAVSGGSMQGRLRCDRVRVVHFWRDKWTALRGPLSGRSTRHAIRLTLSRFGPHQLLGEKFGVVVGRALQVRERLHRG